MSRDKDPLKDLSALRDELEKAIDQLETAEKASRDLINEIRATNNFGKRLDESDAALESASRAAFLAFENLVSSAFDYFGDLPADSKEKIIAKLKLERKTEKSFLN